VELSLLRNQLKQRIDDTENYLIRSHLQEFRIKFRGEALRGSGECIVWNFFHLTREKETALHRFIGQLKCAGYRVFRTDSTSGTTVAIHWS